MHYSIEIKVQPYANALRAISATIHKPEQILKSVGESLLNANQARHTKNLAPDGTPWQPLAKSTLYRAVDAQQHKVTRIGNKKRGASSNIAAAQKIMARKASRILYQYGDLLRFTYQVTGSELRIGTNDKKAVWHHFGTGKYGTGNGPYIIRPKNRKALAFGGGIFKQVTHPGIPARPLIGFPASDQTIVERIVAEHLATAARKK